MSPADGNFNGSQPVMPGEVKQFGIEAKAFNGLLFEDNFALLAAKGFEAALRVHERQTQDQANDFVENDSGELAEWRFVNADQAAIHGAGTDGEGRCFLACAALPADF